MKRHAWTAVLVLAMLGSAQAAEPVGNDDVIGWTRLGLGDAVILAKIRNAPGRFDTGTSGLVALKQAGVSDAVVAAIIETQAAAAPAGAKPAEMMLGGGEPMTAVRISAETSDRKSWIPVYDAPTETFFFFEGANAARVIDQAQPGFETSLSPDRLTLVHLGHHKGRGTRFVVFSGAGSDRTVPVRSERLDDGRYRLTPQSPLAAGEYAMLVAPDLEADAGTPAAMRGMMGFARTRMAIYDRAFDFAIAPAAGSVAP